MDDDLKRQAEERKTLAEHNNRITDATAFRDLIAAVDAAEAERDEANAARDRQADTLSVTLQRLAEARGERRSMPDPPLSLEQAVRDVLTAVKADPDLFAEVSEGTDPQTLPPSDLVIPANRLGELLRVFDAQRDATPLLRP